MESIGVIGCGRMGEWFAKKLRERYRVGVYDIVGEKALETSIKYGLKKYNCISKLVKESDVIIVATPIEATREVLVKIKEVVSSENLKGKIIFDIASVKSSIYPVLKSFPREVKVCSVHPMFGPGATGFAGHNVIIIPVEGREGDSKTVEEFFSKLGSKITISNLKEHEEMIGVTLGLMYLIGLALGRLAVKYGRDKLERFSGTSYQYLINYSKVVLGESEELIWNLLNLSRSKKPSKEFVEAIREVMERLNSRRELRELISELKSEFGENEVKESYKKFYEVIYEIL